MDTTPEHLTHQLLIAMPNQAGSYFAETVTYMCEHNDDGALGIVVNQPLEVTVCELLESLELPTGGADPERLVLRGGPVQTERGFILHSDDLAYPASSAIGNGLMLSTAQEVLEAIGSGHAPERYLVALGYAGWAGGQLEGELAANAWLTCPSSHELLFDVPFEDRVERAAQTLGFDFRLMSTQIGHA